MATDDSGGHGAAISPATGIRSENTTRVAVIADVHLATEASGTWKCYHLTEPLLRRVLADLHSRDVDGTIIAGDLTKDGEPHNFDRFDKLIAPLDLPVTIPGNHDVPKSYVDHSVPPIEQFAARYTTDGYPFHRKVGGVDILCLNSATMPEGSLQETWGGRVSQAQLAWLNKKLDTVSTPVVVMHHNLFAQPEHHSTFGSNFQVNNHEALLEILSQHAPVLVVSGHHHIPSLETTRGVTEVIVPAVCSYPTSYVLLEIGPQGVNITRIPVATPYENHRFRCLRTADSDLGSNVLELARDRVRENPYSGKY